MDSPEFKPFELKDFDSEVSVQEALSLIHISEPTRPY